MRTYTDDNYEEHRAIVDVRLDSSSRAFAVCQLVGFEDAVECSENDGILVSYYIDADLIAMIEAGKNRGVLFEKSTATVRGTAMQQNADANAILDDSSLAAVNLLGLMIGVSESVDFEGDEYHAAADVLDADDASKPPPSDEVARDAHDETHNVPPRKASPDLPKWGALGRAPALQRANAFCVASGVYGSTARVSGVWKKKCIINRHNDRTALPATRNSAPLQNARTRRHAAKTAWSRGG